MDKILSARVDEAVIWRINFLARRLGTTKKAIIEQAIRSYAEQVEAEHQLDVLEHTCGAWQRIEPPRETVDAARRAFRRSMERHHG